AAGEWARGIHRDDSSRETVSADKHREVVHERALAGAWRAGHADHVSVARARIERGCERRRRRLVVFNTGYRSREGAPIAVQDALGQIDALLVAGIRRP